MRTHWAIKLEHALERYFPERRVFLKSDSDTRFLRLKPVSQFTAFLGASAVLAWAIIATAILVMDSIGAGNFREQAKRDQRTYESRLNALEASRDLRTNEALATQEYFASALEQISEMQTQLLVSETRRRELETGMDVIQNTLRRTMGERDEARARVSTLELALNTVEDQTQNSGTPYVDGGGMVAMLTAALADTARERDEIEANAQDALLRADEMAQTIRLMEDQNDQIFRQLEEAMSISVEPLDKMFRAAGLSTDNLLSAVRRGYSGQGGPLTPLSFSTMGDEPSLESLRANAILQQLDEINLYRLAAQKAPFAFPIKSSYRFTSGFGMRWGRMHNGVDYAAPHGTPIYATADGVIKEAEWQSGYGRVVIIQHDFGMETRYGHLSRIRVKPGQRVSRGDRIGDMGNTGRSTGTHLHYEIRVGGKPVNPMIYIKAGRDVF
ncbi:MAG: M23 family metallopeptidase [Pseudomonadota bacterium]